MFRPYTWDQLKSLSEEQLIAAYDESVNVTAVGTEYYLEEIRHRRQARIAASVEKLTGRILWLTVCVTVLTILNVGVTVFNVVR